MRIFNFGSLNIDRVYSTEHFVRPGETLTCNSYNEYAGGKGLNQSIALARAGAKVCHIGKIGRDGTFLKDLLSRDRVDVESVFSINGQTGHAIIQVDSSGENAILLFGGTNQLITENDIVFSLERANEGDYLLLQNEINRIDDILRFGAEKKLKIAFNPAPMTPEVHSFPLELVDLLIVNEVEGEMVTGRKFPQEILETLIDRYPDMAILLTLGGDGVHFTDNTNKYYIPAEQVVPVDTTGAGDTFIGYYLAEIIGGKSVKQAMITATRAAALCVTRPGAADSIPRKEEIA